MHASAGLDRLPTARKIMMLSDLRSALDMALTTRHPSTKESEEREMEGGRDGGREREGQSRLLVTA